jgi:hypothetical protein
MFSLPFLSRHAILPGHNYPDTPNVVEHNPMPPSPRRKKTPPPRGPGRPDQGIRSGFVRVEIWLPREVRDGLDRLVDRRERQTSESTTRADVIRESLSEYLRQHLPDAKI